VIEALFSIVSAIVEWVISLLGIVFEFIAGFFVTAGETLSVIDLFVVLLLVLLELVLWFILWGVELVVSLFRWRKPNKINKPKLWRPKAKLKKIKAEE